MFNFLEHKATLCSRKLFNNILLKRDNAIQLIDQQTDLLLRYWPFFPVLLFFFLIISKLSWSVYGPSWCWLNFYFTVFLQRDLVPFQIQLCFKTRDQQRFTRVITEKRPVTTCRYATAWLSTVKSQAWTLKKKKFVCSRHCLQSALAW